VNEVPRASLDTATSRGYQVGLSSRKTSVRNASSLRIGMCAPIERETPIVEILDGQNVVADLSCMDDDPSKPFVVLFHDAVAGVQISVATFMEALAEANAKLRREVDE